MKKPSGAFYYKKFAAGEAIEDEVTEFCTAISVHLANIEEKKAAISAGKRTASDSGAAEVVIDAGETDSDTEDELPY